MEANLFTDDWPDYTTVVSQEFAPRLSRVADIRFHSKRADQVMQVLNEAGLLKKTGNWQGIFCKKKKMEILHVMSCHAGLVGRGV